VKRNLRCRRYQCAIALPLFPFLYEHVVPLPLHIYLGLGQQLMDMVDDELIAEADRMDYLALITQCKGTPLGVYSAQKYTSAMSFNGGELKKLIDGDNLPVPINRISNEETCIYLHLLHQAVRSLRLFLLSNDSFDAQQLYDFNELVTFIGDTWPRRKLRVKPKVHMLFHCVEFVRQHHALGRYGEGPIESCHHDVHFTFENHGNSGGNLVSKQRRLHSDIVQRRISRVESESIPLPPAPRLCPQCGHPWARYLHGGHVHVCA